MSQIPYRGVVKDDISAISAADVSGQLAAKTYGRSLLYLQWALYNAVNPASYPGLKVTGEYNADTQRALDDVRGGQYGTSTYAPLTGPTVSRAFLAALLTDYGDFPTPHTVVA